MIDKIFYRKIKNKEVNPLTEEEWQLEDVPVRWRAEVESLLEEADEDMV